MIYNFSKISYICGLLTLVLFSTKVLAHEIRPAYLEIKEDSVGSYSIIWKVPMLDNRIPDIYPVFEASDQLYKNQESSDLQAHTTHMQLTTTTDIGGSELLIYNLEKTLIDAVVRIERASGEIHTLLLQPSAPKALIPNSSNRWQVARTFSVLGIEHILLGWDHLLFVFGLLLLIKRKPILISTITAFTIAHSITLAMSSLGHLSLPSAPVETVIALSVIFLGREYVMELKGHTSLTAQKPWLIAFVFGLLHGFGFAGALSNIGLPSHAVFSSLLSFNLGVEIGQLIFVFALIVLYQLFKKILIQRLSATVKIIPGYIIGGIASFWFIERLLDIVI